MTKRTNKTLGQRIDAVLEPLYEEAEQHRATIELATQQQQSLQEQIDAARAGLSQIESRMAQFVRAMAQQEPVIAAVVGGAVEQVPTESPEAIQAPGIEPEAPAVDAAEIVEEPEAIAEEPVIAEAIEEPVEMLAAIEPDLAADAVAVDEAAAILASPPAPVAVQVPQQPVAAPPVAAEPKIDLAAAAERAAIAAKQLREKASAK